MFNFITRSRRRLKCLRFRGPKSKHLNCHHDCHGTWIRITDEAQNEGQS